MIEVSILAWNVNDQVKRRKKEILAKREIVIEWIRQHIEKIHCNSTKKSEIIEKIGYCVSLGRLNYIKRHSDFRTLRDLIRICSIENFTAPIKYQNIEMKVMKCLNETSWFYNESEDSIDIPLLNRIILEQCPLCWIHSCDIKKLNILVDFLVSVWIQLKTPNDVEIGEAIFPISESITDNFIEQSKITGMVIEFICNSNRIDLYLKDKQKVIDLLNESLKLLRQSMNDNEDD